MFNLFFANLKMMVRGRQALFWSLFFPLMFTIIFGFFFGGSTTNVGTIGLINQSKSELATSITQTMKDSTLFKVKDEPDLNTAKNDLKKSTISAVIEIPRDFGDQTPNAPTQINIVNDPQNAQVNAVISGFLENYLTSVNFQIQKAKPIYSLNIETSTDSSLTYFDFILIGLIGMALMNSSIQGIAISMAKYRQDKILKRITTTPLKSWKFIFAEVLSRLVLNIFQIALILVIGIYGFHAHILGSIFLVYSLALLGGLLFQSIGFAISSVATTVDAAQGMSIAVTIPMMFLAGVFFPTDSLPKWLFSIVQYLPLSPLLRMMRQIGLENISPLTSLINIEIVLAWIVVMLSVSIMRFRLTDE